jgi:hypothetical protein
MAGSSSVDETSLKLNAESGAHESSLLNAATPVLSARVESVSNRPVDPAHRLSVDGPVDKARLEPNFLHLGRIAAHCVYCVPQKKALSAAAKQA